ncbi:MAG: hypothetical protein IBJ03_04515 [Gemmatimonadaceae bacterium]|nr:hypothetical protein [Gemmatimonadaceae bacterium]
MANSLILRCVQLLVCFVTCFAPLAEIEAQRPLGKAPPDSGNPRAIASFAVRRYLTQARTMWLGSEQVRVGGQGDKLLGKKYGAYVHCHARETDSRYTAPIRPEYRGIFANSAYALCPSWLLEVVPPSVHRATRQGLYFDATSAAKLTLARDSLRTILSTSLNRAPGDGWIFGQHIRFLVYDSLYTQALRALEECGTEPWLCAALTAYVHHARGSDKDAEAHFARAMSAVPPDERCGLTDIASILPPEQRDEYERQTCDVRDALAQRYFWLADPAWTTRVNERRVTHMARRMAAVLHSSTECDERYDLFPTRGGPVVLEMLLRYGWPSLSTWIGETTDSGHDGYLQARGTTPSPPYSTAEYDGARVAFGAPSLLFLDETRAPPSAWQPVAPAGAVGRHSRRSSDEVWWPFEHITMPGTRVVAFTDWQIATFRRQTEIQIATAVDMTATRAIVDSLRVRGDTLSLLMSPEQDSVVRIATLVGAGGNSAVMTSRMAPVSGVISLELHGGSTDRILGRMRSGYRAPNTLAALGGDSIAMSDPVLFRADAPLPSDVNAMLPHMLPTVNVPRRSIGLFWEVYGVPVGDSVQFTIAITPRQRPGFLRRAVAALRLMAAPVNGVAIGWNDPSSAPTAAVDALGARTTPILPRALRVDLSQLSPGEYVIEISATDAKQRTALASRAIRVQ